MDDEVTSPTRYHSTRVAAQRLCTHVISRDRHRRDGHVGLAWTGAGIGTDRLWLAADGLHRAHGAALPLVPPTSLAAAASFAGVDLATDFSVGRETPPAEPVDAPLDVDPGALGELVSFFASTWPVLTGLAEGAPVTLWPEHFDAAFVWRDRANVGASPGDAFHAGPYVYVGPWGDERPGDGMFWNAPFGAALAYDGDTGRAAAFLQRGISLLAV
jgi:hypothetical protein